MKTDAIGKRFCKGFRRTFRGGASILSVAGVLLLAGGCELEESKKGLGQGHDFGDNDRNLVVALGDSVTEGSGYRPYPSILQDMIGKTVINAGIGGEQASGGAGRIRGILGRKPGYVLILYGLNDALQGVPVEQTVGALRHMIRAARANKTVPALGTLPAQTGAYSRFSGHVARLNRAIRALAEEEKVRVAPIDRQVGPSRISEDGLHPNQQGYQAIAAAFADLF